MKSFYCFMGGVRCIRTLLEEEEGAAGSSRHRGNKGCPPPPFFFFLPVFTLTSSRPGETVSILGKQPGGFPARAKWEMTENFRGEREEIAGWSQGKRWKRLSGGNDGREHPSFLFLFLPPPAGSIFISFFLLNENAPVTSSCFYIVQPPRYCSSA